MPTAYLLNTCEKNHEEQGLPLSVRIGAHQKNLNQQNKLKQTRTKLTVPVSAVGQSDTVPVANPQSLRPPEVFATEPPAPFELDHRLEVEPSKVEHAQTPVFLSQMPRLEHSLASRLPVTLEGLPP